ncbi:MAG: flavodoxin family protein [Bacillota bacterium]
MQRLLIIYTPDDNLKKMAEGLKTGAEEAGFQVDMVNTADDGTGVSFFPYDLIAAGSPTKGIFRGKIDSSLGEFLSKSKRTLGKEAVAFVTPGFFATRKALKNVMSLLEKEGCVVKNFFEAKDYETSVKFGENLKL